MPFPPSQLRPAVNRAFDTLGPQAKEGFLDHPHKEAVDLERESQCTVNQLAAALDQLFAKDAAVLMMEMVRHFLKKKV
jgi:hypothetical protein